jgi:hypothetical protein
MKAQSRHVDFFKFHIRGNFRKSFIDKGAIQGNVRNLALSIEQVGIDLFFPKSNNNLYTKKVS